MEIKNVTFDYHIDILNKRIHLLNLDSRRKISDVIGYDFKIDFITQKQLLIDVLDFDWYLYESSGIIVLYKNSSYFLISKLLPYLHKDFIERLEKKGNN